MITDFDKALLNKVKNVFPNSQYADSALVYNTAFQLAEVDSIPPANSLRFPLINIFRPTGFELNKNQSFAARQRGLSYFYSTLDNITVQTRFMTARLPYQFDIYDKTPEGVNELAAELIMFLNFSATLEVSQKDSENWFVIKYTDGVVTDTKIFSYEVDANRYVNSQPIVTGVTYTVEQSAFVESYEITYDNGPTEQSEFTNGDRVYHLAIVYSIYNAKILDFRNTKGIGSTDVTVTIEEE